MAKTKTLGIRVTPNLNNDLEHLKSAFGFSSYGAMLEFLVRFLGTIDKAVSDIDKHPRDWSQEEVEEYLQVSCGSLVGSGIAEIRDLLWRRLRERFGEHGMERLQQLISEDSLQKR